MVLPALLILAILYSSSHCNGAIHVANPISIVNEPQQTADSWLFGWDYRVWHVIQGIKGAGSNYPTQIIVQFESGISTGNILFLDSKSQNDFDDIRFTAADGVSELDYWVEEVHSSINATFWVCVSESLDDDVVIYIYYGNDDVDITSDGESTFTFFDDFESGNLDKWDSVLEWAISEVYMTDGTYGALCLGSGLQKTLRHNMNESSSFMVRIDTRTFDEFNTFPVLFSSDVGSCYPCTLGWSNVLYHTGVYNSWPYNSSLADDTWYKLEIGVDLEASLVYGWKDGAFMGTVPFVTVEGYTPSEIVAFRPGAGTQSGRDIALDNVVIRKWIPSEPTQGSWGSEEVFSISTSFTTISSTSSSSISTESTSSTIPSTTPTNSTPFTIWTLISLTITIGSFTIIVIFIVLLYRNR